MTDNKELIARFYPEAIAKISAWQVPEKEGDGELYLPLIDFFGASMDEEDEDFWFSNSYRVNIGFPSAEVAISYAYERVFGLGFQVVHPEGYAEGEFDVFVFNEKEDKHETKKVIIPITYEGFDEDDAGDNTIH